MRVALHADCARTGTRRRALEQFLTRTGLAAETWAKRVESRKSKVESSGAEVALCWGGEQPERGVWMPCSMDPEDRIGWRERARKFVASWKGYAFERQGDLVVAREDLPTLLLGLVDQWDEELVNQESFDEQGRFSPEASILGEARQLASPVVDRIARELRSHLERLACTPAAPQEALGGFALTFDIDSEGMFRGEFMYHMAAAAARSGARTMAKFAARGALSNSRILPDPHLEIEGLCQLVEGIGTRASFHVQTHRVHRLDSYELTARSPLVAPLRRAIREGHEVGLHSSYATTSGEIPLRRQRARLARLLPGAKPIHRAHYLRAGIADEWRDAALLDSSLGYASTTGFRLGTSIPFRISRRACEAPPAAMDVTLRHREGLSPERACERVLKMARDLRATDGVLVSIWHPHNLEPILWPGWKESLADLLLQLRRDGIRVGPMHELSLGWLKRGRETARSIEEALSA